MSASEFNLSHLQRAAVDGFLQQMAIMGVAPEDLKRRPRPSLTLRCVRATALLRLAKWAIT